MLGAGPFGHVGANLADHLQGRVRVHAVDPGQVHSVIRYKCVQTSKRGAFPLIRFWPDFADGGLPVLRSSNRSNWASISRSHSAILS